MGKLSKTAHKTVTIISLLTEVLTNLLSDTKGASKALTHHSWLTISHALLSGLLKHPTSIELLLEPKTHLSIVCSRPVWASGPGSPNPVLNIHEIYLPHHYHLICPPEAHQPPSLGQHSLICPQEVCLTPSSGSCAHLCSSLACMPAVPWHHPLAWLEVALWLMMARACSICWAWCLMPSMAEESDQSPLLGQ